MGDYVLIRQAVLNLITNACQAMNGQEEPQEIRLATWHDEQHVLSVCGGTTVPGFRRRIARKFFETFFSTKGKNGTGLGLAVVRNVMRQHGGDVTLGDAPERGAQFVLRFPLAKLDEIVPDTECPSV